MSEIVNKSVEKEMVQSDLAALAELDLPQNIPPVAEEPAKEEDVPPPAAPDPEPEPVVEKKEEAPPVELPEDAIRPRPHARQETHKDFDAIKAIVKDERTQKEAALAEAKELKQKLEDLDKEYKGKIITPEMEKDYEDLRELRRTYQTQNDPEFKAKWDGELKRISDRALGVLKTNSSPLSPDVEKFIQDRGGVVTMYNSTKMMPKPFDHQTEKEFIEETIGGKLTGISKARFEQALAAALDAQDEMSREIEQAKTQGSEKQKQKQQALEERFKQSVNSTRKSFGKMAEKLEASKDASKEERAKVDAHNKRVDDAEKLFSEYMKHGNDPEKLAEAMARAAHSQILTEAIQDKEADLEAANKTIKELNEKIEKMKKSGSTGTATTAVAPKTQPAGTLLSDEQALTAAGFK